MRAKCTIGLSVFPGTAFYLATIWTDAQSVSSGRFAGGTGRLLRFNLKPFSNASVT